MDKIISFFWGNETMSFLRYMTLWSFSQLNPDWQIRLFVCRQQRTQKYWSDSNKQDFCHYSGVDYTYRLNAIPNLQIIDWETKEKHWLDLGPSHKSNFFKWDLMAIEGGIYADMDILFIKPIDCWFEYVKNSDVGICYNGYFSIGLLSSLGNNKFYKDIYEESVSGIDIKSYQGAGVDAIYRLIGKRHTDHLKKIHSKYPLISFANFSMDYIYYHNCSNIHKMTYEIHTSLPNNSFGLHWYAGHNLSQTLNNTLTEDNVKTHKSTIAYFIRKLL